MTAVTLPTTTYRTTTQHAYAPKREGNSVARSLQGGSRPVYASYLRNMRLWLPSSWSGRRKRTQACMQPARMDGLGGLEDAMRGEERRGFAAVWLAESWVRCWFALQLAASGAAVLICWMLGLRLALRESPVAARHTTAAHTRARMCLRARLRASARGFSTRIVCIVGLEVKHQFWQVQQQQSASQRPASDLQEWPVRASNMAQDRTGVP